MAADNFIAGFEGQFKCLLPSVGMYKMRPANGDLCASFLDLDDFLIVVNAASGANIFMEVGWLFDSKGGAERGIGECYLRFELLNNCADARLIFFLREVINIRRSGRGVGSEDLNQVERRVELLARAL